MEIDAKNFIEIMKKNFRYKVVKTPLGEGIEMDCFSAFIYSSITGAGYLDDPLYPFTPKGLMKVFYNALDYKFVTGLFDNTTLKNTPYNLFLAKRFLFEGNKVIIPVEFTKEIELQKKLSNFVNTISPKKSTDYIIQRIECVKRGFGMEPFMEYLASEYFKRKGYVVETQIPLSHKDGSPDLGGYIIAHNKKEISLNKINIIELALIRLGIRREHDVEKEDDSLIVGEAKTSTTLMSKQLEKYLETKIFNEGYEIHPYKKEPSKEYFGLITLDNNKNIVALDPKTKVPCFEKVKQDKYVKWLKNYLKYYLIANFTNDEFNNFYLEKRSKRISSKEDIIDFINGLSYREILKKIGELM